MSNRIVIRAALYLPACVLMANFLYRFAWFFYIDVYLSSVGSVQNPALASAFMLLIYALFLRWANPRFAGARSADRLRDLALQAPVAFSASALLVALIGHSVEQGSLSGLVPDPVAMAAIFLVMASVGYLYVGAAAIAVGLNWFIRYGFGRFRGWNSTSGAH